jgi:hypothetical protein
MQLKKPVEVKKHKEREKQSVLAKKYVEVEKKPLLRQNSLVMDGIFNKL